jgi:HlyD family secretion protein
MSAATERGRGGLNGRLTWIILIGLILAVIVLAAFISLRRARVAIRVGRVERGTITASISTNGKIEPINNFESHAPTATTVSRVDVQQGDWVKAGTLLLQLQDANARAQAARAEAQLRGAQAEMSAVTSGGTQEEVLTTRNALIKAQADRDAAHGNLQAMEKLLQTGAASQAEVDAARNQLKIAESNVQLLQQKLKDRYSAPEVGHVEAQQAEAKASLAAAEELLRNSNIRAPFEGMVYSLPVKRGSFVNAGDLLVQLADLHKVRVRAFVDEPEIGRLRSGQLVEVTWDALPGRVWKGELETLPTVIVQRSTRMVGEVTCIVDNSDLKLLPNTNVSVAVIIDQHENVLTVPREAIHQDSGGRYVFQVVDGELKRRDVQTSVADLTRVEVTSGLPDHAVLALGAINSQSLEAGMPVKIVD